MENLGDLVVDTTTGAGKYGGYDGGFGGALLVPGQWLADNTGFGTANIWTGLIVVLVILVIAILLGVTLGFVSGYRDHSGTRIAHASTRDDGYGEPSETNIRLAAAISKAGGVEAFRDQDAFARIRSGFVNAREAPYYPDVTNRVLRMENREKEAVRALGKINQERLRRAAEDTSSTTPLPWGPFWREWKQTHPMDGEAGYGLEGFEGGEPQPEFNLPAPY